MEKTNNANFIKVLYSSCFILFIIIFNNGELVLNDEPLTFEYEDRQSTVEQLQSR